MTLLPRVLGPEQYGTFALALSVVLIASSAMTLGGAPLMARYVPTVKPNERPALAPALALRLAAWQVFANSSSFRGTGNEHSSTRR